MNNQRPISLFNVVYQIFTRIISNRIARQLENHPEEQAGFKQSTIPLKKANDYRIPLAVALGDYTKTFDGRI